MKKWFLSFALLLPVAMYAMDINVDMPLGRNESSDEDAVPQVSDLHDLGGAQENNELYMLLRGTGLSDESRQEIQQELGVTRGLNLGKVIEVGQKFGKYAEPIASVLIDMISKRDKQVAEQQTELERQQGLVSENQERAERRKEKLREERQTSLWSRVAAGLTTGASVLATAWALFAELNAGTDIEVVHSGNTTCVCPDPYSIG